MPTPPDDETLPALVIAILAPVVETLIPVKAPVTVIEEDWMVSMLIVSVEGYPWLRYSARSRCCW